MLDLGNGLFFRAGIFRKRSFIRQKKAPQIALESEACEGLLVQ